MLTEVFLCIMRQLEKFVCVCVCVFNDDVISRSEWMCICVSLVFIVPKPSRGSD